MDRRDSSRAEAVWHNEPQAPLQWTVDGESYRPTTLVKHMFAQIGKRRRALQGPNWWTVDSDRRRLTEVADDLEDQAEL